MVANVFYDISSSVIGNVCSNQYYFRYKPDTLIVPRIPRIID